MVKNIDGMMMRIMMPFHLLKLDDLYAADIDYKFMDFYMFKNALNQVQKTKRN